MVASTYGIVSVPLAQEFQASRMVLMLALIVAMFHHMQLGLQVVIEDYIRAEKCRLAALLAMKAVTWLLGISAAVSALKMGLGG